MTPATARRQLMNDFHGRLRQAFQDLTSKGFRNATILLLDLRDDRAQKMAADVADMDVVRDLVTSAQEDGTAPVLVAATSSRQAARLMRGRSRKSKSKFAVVLPPNRFRLIVVGDGGITWAVGAAEAEGPTGRIVG